MSVHVGRSMAFHKAITLRLSVCAAQAIPQCEILAVVIVEVEMVHSVARSVVDDLRPSHVLGVVWK